jgi:hypothetical protein
VTGLDTLAQRPEALLVTTRDSRVRLYNGPLLSVKYKGHRNKQSRIPATLSPDGTFVICGSDDGSTVSYYVTLIRNPKEMCCMPPAVLVRMEQAVLCQPRWSLCPLDPNK